MSQAAGSKGFARGIVDTQVFRLLRSQQQDERTYCLFLLPLTYGLGLIDQDLPD